MTKPDLFLLSGTFLPSSNFRNWASFVSMLSFLYPVSYQLFMASTSHLSSAPLGSHSLLEWHIALLESFCGLDFHFKPVVQIAMVPQHCLLCQFLTRHGQPTLYSFLLHRSLSYRAGLWRCVDADLIPICLPLCMLPSAPLCSLCSPVVVTKWEVKFRLSLRVLDQ